MRRRLKFRQSKLTVPAEEVRPGDPKTLLYRYLYAMDNYKLTYNYRGAIPYAEQGFYTINASWFRSIDEIRRIRGLNLRFPEPTTDVYNVLDKDNIGLLFSGKEDTIGGRVCFVGIDRELIDIIRVSNEPVPIWFQIHWPEGVTFSHLNCLIVNKVIDVYSNVSYTIDRFEPAYEFGIATSKDNHLNKGLVDLLKSALGTDQVSFNDPTDELRHFTEEEAENIIYEKNGFELYLKGWSETEREDALRLMKADSFYRKTPSVLLDFTQVADNLQQIIRNQPEVRSVYERLVTPGNVDSTIFWSNFYGNELLKRLWSDPTLDLTTPVKSGVFSVGPQFVEDNIVYYSGEPGGYCAMWCASALNIYMDHFRESSGRYTFLQWMKALYSATEIISETGQRQFDFAIVKASAKNRGLALRKWIQTEASNLLEGRDEFGNIIIKNRVVESICRNTLTPSNEYLLRGYLNAYFSDPQSLFNIIVPQFFPPIAPGIPRSLTKLTLTYFGEREKARENISTKDEFDKQLETEMFNALYANNTLTSVYVQMVKENVAYDCMLWVEKDEVGRDVVWLMKVPRCEALLNLTCGAGRYTQNIGSSGPNTFSSILYLEDRKIIKQIDVGHANALQTIKYPDSSLAFRRFDPDFSPDIKKHQMVYIDADGKWNKALAKGILNIFRIVGFSNITGNAEESFGIKIFNLPQSTEAFPGPQTLERDLPRESGEFIGYCQIWTLRLLELTIGQTDDLNQAYINLMNDLYFRAGGDTIRLKQVCRQYIREQASRYASFVIRKIAGCDDYQERLRQQQEQERLRQQLEQERLRQQQEQAEPPCAVDDINPDSLNCDRKNAVKLHPDKHPTCPNKAAEKFKRWSDRCTTK